MHPLPLPLPLCLLPLPSNLTSESGHQTSLESLKTAHRSLPRFSVCAAMCLVSTCCLCAVALSCVYASVLCRVVCTCPCLSTVCAVSCLYMLVPEHSLCCVVSVHARARAQSVLCRVCTCSCPSTVCAVSRLCMLVPKQAGPGWRRTHKTARSTGRGRPTTRTLPGGWTRRARSTTAGWPAASPAASTATTFRSARLRRSNGLQTPAHISTPPSFTTLGSGGLPPVALQRGSGAAAGTSSQVSTTTSRGAAAASPLPTRRWEAQQLFFPLHFVAFPRSLPSITFHRLSPRRCCFQSQWSGAYEITSATWVIAHTTQFAPAGWCGHPTSLTIIEQDGSNHLGL